RRVAPPDTIGGGIVVDPSARRHGARPELVERLQALLEGREPEPTPEPQPQPQPPAVPHLAGRHHSRLGELLRADGERPRTDSELAAAAGLDAAAARAELAALERSGRAVRVGQTLHFDAGVLAELTARVVALCERDGAV